MVTRKTQYAWMAVGGVLCLSGVALVCALREGNRAVAQADKKPTDDDGMVAAAPMHLPGKPAPKPAEPAGKKPTPEPADLARTKPAADKAPDPLLKKAEPPDPLIGASPAPPPPPGKPEAGPPLASPSVADGPPMPPTEKPATFPPSRYTGVGSFAPRPSIRTDDAPARAPGKPIPSGPPPEAPSVPSPTGHAPDAAPIPPSFTPPSPPMAAPVPPPSALPMTATRPPDPAPVTPLAPPAPAPAEADTVKPLPSLRPVVDATGPRPVQPLIGTYPCKLENLKALTLKLPPALREQLAGCDAVLVSPGPDRCLWLTNQAHLERLAQRLEQSPAREIDVRVFKRLYYAQTVKLALSGDGHITIPERLAQFANLHQEVVLVGIDDHFEVWDATRWRQYTQQKSNARTGAGRDAD